MKVLLVDDEERSRKAVAFFVREALGWEVFEAEDGEHAFEAYKKYSFPLVISDIRMPKMNGIELLKEIKKLPEGEETSVVLMTGFADVETAVTALREGAYDYLHKPVNAETLSVVLNKLSEDKTRKEGEKKPGKEVIQDISQTILIPDYGTIGVFSSEMQDIVKLAYQFNEDRQIPALIQGETGTGKEVVARLIHHGSEGTDKPFVSVNCPALAPTLIESEFFGYEPGAYTGATKTGAKGKFELAQGGTIFLDEIGELPLDMQPKLLRVLQERELYKIGGDKRIKLDVRFIAATNRNLHKEVKKGNFRGDLFYRLNAGKIDIPPLREQSHSIRHLAQLILIQLSEQKGKDFKYLDSDAVKLLESHNWPGNIRELHNTLERVMLLYNDNALKEKHLGFISGHQQQEEYGFPPLSADTIVLPEETLDFQEITNAIIRLALKKFNGNKSRTAEYLGMSRGALRNRVENL